MPYGLSHHEHLRRIRYALETMDALPLAAFERARFRDLDYNQIAEDLGISTEEVERQLVAAMVHIVVCVKRGGGH